MSPRTTQALIMLSLAANIGGIAYSREQEEHAKACTNDVKRLRNDNSLLAHDEDGWGDDFDSYAYPENSGNKIFRSSKNIYSCQPIGMKEGNHFSYTFYKNGTLEEKFKSNSIQKGSQHSGHHNVSANQHSNRKSSNR